MIFKNKYFLHSLSLLVGANGFCRQSHLSLRGTHQPSSSSLRTTSLISNSLSELLTVKHTLPGSSRLARWYRHLADSDRSSIKRITRGRSRSCSNLLPWQPPEWWLTSIQSRCALEMCDTAGSSVGRLDSCNQVWCWLSNPADYICLGS